MEACVIIPTYQERNNIAQVVSLALASDPRIHVTVVDDNSPDGTVEAAQEAGASYPGRLEVHRRPAKFGLGSAYVYGFSRALEAGFDLILEMDADLSHDPRDLPRLIAAADEADLVLGSRYVPGGRVDNWPPSRRLLSRAGNFYARFILGLPIRDLTGGFKCYHRRVIEAIDVGSIHSTGYAFQVETTYRALLKGFRVREIPIVFVERREGHSKMTRSIMLEASLLVWKFRLLGPRLFRGAS
ncbi:MAG: polyprenol monophosphomannose synthase [Planctomycetota bacterium]